MCVDSDYLVHRGKGVDSIQEINNENLVIDLQELQNTRQRLSVDFAAQQIRDYSVDCTQ